MAVRQWERRSSNDTAVGEVFVYIVTIAMVGLRLRHFTVVVPRL